MQEGDFPDINRAAIIVKFKKPFLDWLMYTKLYFPVRLIMSQRIPFLLPFGKVFYDAIRHPRIHARLAILLK